MMDDIKGQFRAVFRLPPFHKQSARPIIVAAGSRLRVHVGRRAIEAPRPRPRFQLTPAQIDALDRHPEQTRVSSAHLEGQMRLANR